MIIVFVSFIAAACGAGSYCQTGPKYGTQCYAEHDVKHPPDGPPRDDPSREK